MLQPSVARRPRQHNWPHSLWVGRIAPSSPPPHNRSGAWRFPQSAFSCPVSGSLKRCCGASQVSKEACAGLQPGSIVRFGGVLTSGWN
ncbi:hypothetical protein MHYP_G00201280 [Metynnis hypsauchen]